MKLNVETILEDVLYQTITLEISKIDQNTNSRIKDWLSIGDKVEITRSIESYKGVHNTRIEITSRKLVDNHFNPVKKIIDAPQDIKTFNRIVKLIPLTLWDSVPL